MKLQQYLTEAKSVRVESLTNFVDFWLNNHHAKVRKDGIQYTVKMKQVDKDTFVKTPDGRAVSRVVGFAKDLTKQYLDKKLDRMPPWMNPDKGKNGFLSEDILTEGQGSAKVAKKIGDELEEVLSPLFPTISIKWDNDGSIESRHYSNGDTYMMMLLKNGGHEIGIVQVYVKNGKISGWMPTNGTTQYSKVARAVDKIIGKSVGK